MYKPKVFDPKMSVGDLRTFYSNEFSIPEDVLTEPKDWRKNDGQLWKTWPLEWLGIKGFAAQRVG